MKCFFYISQHNLIQAEKTEGGKYNEEKTVGEGKKTEELGNCSLPFSGLSLALSHLIRKLMQLSVLILESSFYNFSFSLTPFFYSPLICAVPADDKTGHVRRFLSVV